MTTPLIGLLGRARSGKDTLASFLIDDYGFRRFAFADPLKAAAVATNPIVSVESDEVGPLVEAGYPRPTRFWEPTHVRLAVLVDLVGWEAAKAVREVRRYLQAHGVAMRDNVDGDVWVSSTLNRVEAHLAERAATPCLPAAPVVITDVRFPNEADAIRAAGGLLVRVLREGSGLSGAVASHSSETALDDYVVHLTVDNDGSLADLREEARFIVDGM